MNKFFVLIVSLFMVSALHGQRSYEIGGWLGLSQYYGDLNPNVNIASPGLAGGIIGQYNFNSRVGARLSANLCRIHADDANSSNNFNKNRNLNFFSNVLDLNLGVVFNFFDYFHNVADENYSPYVVGGFSLLRHNPKTTYKDKVYDLRRLGTEGQEENQEYLLLTGAYTLGVGFKWDIATDWNLAVEGSMRFAMTDYLDDVSTSYPDYDELESLRGKEAVILANRSLNRVAGKTGNQRGNSVNNDSFVYIGVSLMKHFGRLDCPRISDTKL